MKPLSISFLVFLISITAIAQDEPVESRGLFIPKAEFGFGFQVLAPTGTFLEKTNSIPAGMNGYYYHRVGKKFMIGGELNVSCISHAEYEVTNDNGETGMLHEEEGMWGIMIGSRFNFLGSRNFRSYTEVRAGANSFYSSITSCDESLKSYHEHKTHGTSFVTSIGLGLQFDPKGIIKKEPGKTWITIRGAYVAGTEVGYRHAPESAMPLPLNSYVSSAPVSYFDIGMSASWQIR